jgi:hypothetical protein
MEFHTESKFVVSRKEEEYDADARSLISKDHAKSFVFRVEAIA